MTAAPANDTCIGSQYHVRHGGRFFSLMNCASTAPAHQMSQYLAKLPSSQGYRISVSPSAMTETNATIVKVSFFPIRWPSQKISG